MITLMLALLMIDYQGIKEIGKHIKLQKGDDIHMFNSTPMQENISHMLGLFHRDIKQQCLRCLLAYLIGEDISSS